MKPGRLLTWVVVLAGVTLALLAACSRRVASPSSPKLDLTGAKLEFAAARSSEDAADVEIKEVAIVAADGVRHSARSDDPAGITCHIRADGKEQQVSVLAYG
jgi:hypothetical protein